MGLRTVTATEAKNHFGECLEGIAEAPLVITKTRRPFAVVMSHKEFLRLQAIEDNYWGERAKEGAASGYVGVKKSRALLGELAK